MASQLVQGAYQANGKMLGELEEQETNGVRWQMDTIALGASPVTRWLSKEFIYPDQFLYLAQKIEGQDSGKKLIALMGKTLMRQSLQMYGFTGEDTPNFDDAEVLDSVDLRLDEHFLCYTSDALWREKPVVLLELQLDWRTGQNAIHCVRESIKPTISASW